MTEPAKDSPLNTMDAAAWAKEFMHIFGKRLGEIDEGLMIGWFANAIMRGWDEAHWKLAASRSTLSATERERLAQWCEDRAAGCTDLPNPAEPADEPRHFPGVVL